MRKWNLTFVFFLLIIYPGLSTSFAQTDSLVWPELTGVSINKAVEPVFNSRVCVFEAGRENETTLILVHGIGDEGARVWGYLIPELVRKYHVLTFDLPGFGCSEKGNHLYSPGNYARFLDWVISEYAHQHRIMVGHSMGGGLALYFAANYKDTLEKLVLVDAAGILHRSATSQYMMHLQSRMEWSAPLEKNVDNFFESLNHLTGAVLQKLESEQLPFNLNLILSVPLLRKVVLQDSPTMIAGLALVEEDFTDIISTMQTPTWILWGARDEVAPLRTGKLLKARLPRAGLKVVDNVGHVMPVEQPEKFNEVLLAALQAEVPDKKNGQLKHTASGEKRIGKCLGDDGVSFSGSYETIELIGCDNVSLIDVIADHILVIKSSVTMENCIISGKEVGLKVKASNIKATAVEISGDVAIESVKSRFDMAGVVLRSRFDAIVSDDESTYLFSVSYVESKNGQGNLHGKKRVTAGNPL